MEQMIASRGNVPVWTLGWRLRRSLEFAGLTREEMAEELGMSRATLTRWMHDLGGPPRRIYLRQWALRTGVPYAWLAGEDDEARTQESAGLTATLLALVA